jgi:hypothetical protein
MSPTARRTCLVTGANRGPGLEFTLCSSRRIFTWIPSARTISHGKCVRFESYEDDAYHAFWSVRGTRTR